jgi:site-specific DNA recombinase
VTRSNEDDSRASIYCRVSTLEQGQADKPSLEQQEEKAAALAALHDWSIVDVYSDTVSGRKWERPGLHQMLADAEAGSFGRVIVLAIDRLGRNLRDLLEISERLRNAGVGLVSVKETLDTGSASGTLFFQLLGAFAEFETKRIAERTLAGRVGRVAQGKFHGPFAPFGYSYDKETGLLSIDAEQATVVRWLFERSARGDSLNTLAKELEARGVPPPQAARTNEGGKWGWHIQTVSRMLRASRYAGEGAFGDTPMAYPPIVSHELFDEVQTGLATRRYRSPGRTKRPYPLQGLLVCGHCGSLYTPRTNAPNRSVEASGQYGCQERMAYGRDKAGHEDVRWLWPARELEQRLWRYSLRLLFEPDHLLSEAKWLNKQARDMLSEGSKERAALEKRLRKAEESEKRAVDLACAGDITAEELRERRRKARAERKEVERALAALPKSGDPQVLETAQMLLRWAQENVQTVREIDALREALPDLGERLSAGVVARIEALPTEARAILDAMVWTLFRESTQRVTVRDDGTLLVEGRPLSLPTAQRDSPCL